MTNLLTGDTASFTSTLGNWVSASNGPNFTVSWVSPSDDGFMRWTVTTGGLDIAMASSGSTISNKIPVTPGQVLTLTMDTRQTAGATLRNVKLDGHFFDSTQTAVIAAPAQIVVQNAVSTSDWQTIGGSLTVPAGAAYMRMRAFAVAPAVGDVFEWNNAVVDDGVVITVLKPKVKTGTIKSATGAVKQTTAAAVTPVSMANAAQVTIKGNTYNIQSPDKTYSFSAIGDPQTPTYARFELRSGDRWINDINNYPTDSRERCELRLTKYLPFNTDIWSAGSLRVTNTPNTWKPNEYNILTQFIQDPPAGEAAGMNPLDIDIEDGTFQIYHRGDTAATTTVRPPIVVDYTEDWTPRLGQWVSIVMRSRFSNTTANGQLQAWINGTQVINLTGLTMGFNNPVGPYFKYGIYRSGWTSTLVVEWANREVGTPSLLSRVTSPLAVPA